MKHLSIAEGRPTAEASVAFSGGCWQRTRGSKRQEGARGRTTTHRKSTTKAKSGLLSKRGKRELEPRNCMSPPEIRVSKKAKKGGRERDVKKQEGKGQQSRKGTNVQGKTTSKTKKAPEGSPLRDKEQKLRHTTHRGE